LTFVVDSFMRDRHVRHSIVIVHESDKFTTQQVRNFVHHNFNGQVAYVIAG